MTSKALSVLFVEDNDDLREAVGLMLEGPGREVVLCGSAEEALGRIAGRSFDVVLTDLRLPGMSGVDLARELLGIDRHQRVVFCSGEDLQDSILALGPNVSRLSKPFDMADVERLLAEAAQGWD